MNRFLITFAAIALGASAVDASTVVVNAPAPTARVSYADLNLDSTSGKSQLLQRIRAAADGLCLEDNINPLDVRLQRKSCFEGAVADGIRQVESLLAARGSGTTVTVAAAALTIRAR